MPTDESPWPFARPIVKWTGGKTAELAHIAAALPRGASRHIEPFVGGGAVLFALPPSVPAEANDRSADLVALYRSAAARDAGLVAATSAIDAAWEAVSGLGARRGAAAAVGRACAPLDAVFGRGVAARAGQEAERALARKRAFLAGLADAARGGEGPLLEAAVKGGLYTALRWAFNRSAPGAGRAALFWYLRDFCYGGMFRCNGRGEFNVPYGGISYNGRSVRLRLDQLAEPATAARLAAAAFSCDDFEPFLARAAPGPSDFVFLDPPYDSRFASYDGQPFGRSDHGRLAAWMGRTPAKWMLVIAETEFVRETYCSVRGARVASFGKTYQGSIKDRYSRQAVHLLVTNYDWAAGAALAA